MSKDLTQVLQAVSAGDEQAADALMPMVYDDLRRRAASLLRGESPSHTLEATALVNEAYLKLCDQDRTDWQSRTHFFSIGSQAMRRILVDHARAKGRDKRGGGMPRVEWNDEVTSQLPQSTGVLAVHEAIEKLEAMDPRLARVTEMRFFGGMTMPEIAASLGVSLSTVESDWAMSKAWLRRELSEDDAPS